MLGPKAFARRRAVGQATAVLGAVILLTGCGSSAGSTSSPPSTASSQSSGQTGGLATAQKLAAQYEAAPMTISQTVPLRTAPPRGKKFIFLTDGAVPAVVQIGSGEQAAAQAVGWQFSQINYDQSNPDSLQAALKRALLEQPTVVALTGSDVSLFGSSVVAAYRSAKVPIIVSTVGPFAANGVVLGTPGGPATYANAGKALAAWFVTDSDGKGQALLAHVSAFTILNSFTNGFQQEVKALCPACGVKYLNVSVSQAIGGQESSEIVSALRSNPTYKYLIYDEGSFANGITSALRTAGLSDIKVAGNDFSVQDAASLRAHTEAAWTGLDLANFGYGVVDMALRYVEGMPQNTLDNVAPTEVVTPSTIGSQTMFRKPSDALQQYEKLWHVASSTG